MRILCTFSGKFGDILWALPTVRAIASMETKSDSIDGYGVDFGIMPQYRSLLPLLNIQSYIRKAFVIENWECTGSPHGDQPWEAPTDNIIAGKITAGITNEVKMELPYDKVFHLTYRTHPTRDQPLVSFIAGQQGIYLGNIIPFIQIPNVVYGDTKEKIKLIDEIVEQKSKPTVTYAFNPSMSDVKQKFLEEVKSRLEGVVFKDISDRPWIDASCLIANSIAFLGCRSANYVLACGVGVKVFVYEPQHARSIRGPFGTTFTCPFANETEVTQPVEVIDYLKDKVTEFLKKVNEVKSDETNATITR